MPTKLITLHGAVLPVKTLCVLSWKRKRNACIFCLALLQQARLIISLNSQCSLSPSYFLHSVVNRLWTTTYHSARNIGILRAMWLVVVHDKERHRWLHRKPCFLCFVQHGARFGKCLWLLRVKQMKSSKRLSMSCLQLRKTEKPRKNHVDPHTTFLCTPQDAGVVKDARLWTTSNKLPTAKSN